MTLAAISLYWPQAMGRTGKPYPHNPLKGNEKVNTQTPFKTVNVALIKAGITLEEISDERRDGNPVFLYMGTNGTCREDGAHCFTGYTASELIRDIATAQECQCDECRTH